MASALLISYMEEVLDLPIAIYPLAFPVRGCLRGDLSLLAGGPIAEQGVVEGRAVDDIAGSWFVLCL